MRRGQAAEFQAQGMVGTKILRWDKARVTPKLIRRHVKSPSFFVQSLLTEPGCMPAPAHALQGLRGEWGRSGDCRHTPQPRIPACGP